MSPIVFYRQQAAQQQSDADAAVLDNVRERCQRAASAWLALAVRSERTEEARTTAADAKSAGTTAAASDRTAGKALLGHGS